MHGQEYGFPSMSPREHKRVFQMIFNPKKARPPEGGRAIHALN